MEIDRPSLMDRLASGRCCAEGARERHRQHARQARRQADGHAPGQRAAHPAQVFARALHLVQDAAAVFQQQLAGLGGGDAAAVAHQQVLPQFHFQQAHLAAQRRLGHVERLAARVKLPSSATRTKYSSCLRSIASGFEEYLDHRYRSLF